MKRWMIGPLLICVSCSAAPDDGPETFDRASSRTSALSNKDFDVTFAGCAEFAGIGFVPAANARPLVPTSYSLAGTAANAVVVVRVVRCSSSVVDGKSLGETLTSQIGISVTGQDTTADINNYTLFYATNQPLLHARYEAAGLKTDQTNEIDLELSGAKLEADSSSSKTPEFEVEGASAVPTAAPVQFVASWWGNGPHGVVRSRTVLPTIRFGSSTVTLTTPLGSALAKLAGSTQLKFALLDSYNTFASAKLEVRVTN
jgi:hypothetical protein